MDRPVEQIIERGASPLPPHQQGQPASSSSSSSYARGGGGSATPPVKTSSSTVSNSGGGGSSSGTGNRSSLRQRLPSVGLSSGSGGAGGGGKEKEKGEGSGSGGSSHHPPAPAQPKDPNALLEGWLKKRGTRIPGHWSDRYFVLKGDQLMYYLKPTDQEARGVYVLDRSCVVSEVKPYSASSYSYGKDKRKGPMYAFRVLWPEAVEATEHHAPASASAAADDDKDKEKEKDGAAGAGSRGSARLGSVGSLAASASAGASSSSSNSSSSSSSSRRSGSVEVVTQRRALEQQQQLGSFADVAMDPYVQAPYVPPAHQSSTKIVRSLNSLRAVDGSSGRRLAAGGSGGSGGASNGSGSGGSSSSVVPRSGGTSASTLATGGAMVAMAVGGVVVGAMTAGLGLVAPMVIVGVTAAAGGGGVVYGASHGAIKAKQVALVLALDSKDAADEWRAAIEAQIRWSQGFPASRWMSMVGLERRMPSSFRRAAVAGPGKGPTAATKLEDVDRWTRSTRWRPWALYNGLRVYELDHVQSPSSSSSSSSRTAATTTAAAKAQPAARPNRSPLPCRKVQVAVRGTPLETFVALVSVPNRVVNGVVDSVRVVERLDDQSDVIHLTLKPLFLWPTWTAPRDFCLVRYWRYDEDGIYIICYDSAAHRACPPVAGVVRAELHAVYTISPKKHPRGLPHGATAELDDAPECLLTHILQVDPRGWVWHGLGYLDAFIAELLLQVLDVRDLLEQDRFMAVHVDTSEDHAAAARGELPHHGAGGGKAGAGGGGDASAAAGGTIETHRPTVPPEMWAEVDASTFVVRGPSYATSKLKVPSESAAFRLLAVDLFDLPECGVDNIAAHPNNRVQAAIRAGDCPPFVFVVQLQIPGTEQQLGYVSYFAPDDMGIFEEDTPLARVIKPFFFGDDNNYRDLRFKLIPRIVEGNWVVRKSVGSTPAILGTKLKQNYYKGTHYFELDVNIASSSVAAGVVRLAAGYAKTLVVDLALVIQGEEEDELPERVVACWRIKQMDLSMAKKLDG